MKGRLVKYIAIIISIMAFVQGCIDPYEVEVPPGEKRLVVEGRITNDEGPYSVIITYSGNYSTKVNGISEFISGATVCIYDDQDNCAELYESSKGRYITDKWTFRGEIGRSYYLDIILPNGKHYQSKPEKMIQASEIDRVYFEYNPGDEVNKQGFYVYMDAQDPADEHNYYKWESISWWYYSFDPCWNRVPDFDAFNIMEDKNINGNMIARKLIKIVPYTGRTPYVVTVQQMALSESAYKYLFNLNEQLNLTGSIFDPPPTLIRGNLFNVEDPDELVLGYFYAGGFSTMEVAVDRTIPEESPRKTAPILQKPIYCGIPCDPMCVATGGICGEEPCPPACNNLPYITYQPPESWPIKEAICDE